MDPGEDVPAEGLSLRLVQARREVARLRAEVESLRASTSWRLTSPLRFMVARLRDRKPAFFIAHPTVVPDSRIPAELLGAEMPVDSSNDSFRLIDCASHLSGLLSDEVIEVLLPHPGIEPREWNFSDRTDRPIAMISGPALAAEFAFEVPVLRLVPATAVEVLRDRSPEFLLLDTDVHDFGSEWRYALHDESGPIQTVLDACALLDIPVLVWFRCDPGQYTHLAQWAHRADRVYAIDPVIHALLREDVGDAKLELLEAAIQPRLHNPLVTDALIALKPGGLFVALHDALADVRDTAGLKGGQSSHTPCTTTWWIDSYWDVPTSRVQASRSDGHVLMGVVSCAEKLVLSKIADAELFSASAIRPQWKVRQNMLKAAACGSLVVAEPDIVQAWPLRNSQPFASSLDECAALASDEFGAALWRRRVADEVSEGRTILCALTTMRRDLDPHFSVCAPLISCLLVTQRPARLQQALDNFRRQRHPHCELILVLHGQEMPKVDISAEDRRVVVLEAPASVGLGDCLNLAASRALGEYWAKLDDDDHYAPEYLARTHIMLKMAAAEVAGMPLLLTRFESDDAVFCDVSKFGDAFRFERGWRGGEICGATLAGTVDLLRRIPFRSDRRRGVDSRFLDDCSLQGVRIAVGDGFGFLCQRSADVSQHTWEGDEAGVRARGLFLRPEQRAAAGVIP